MINFNNAISNDVLNMIDSIGMNFYVNDSVNPISAIMVKDSSSDYNKRWLLFPNDTVINCGDTIVTQNNKDITSTWICTYFKKKAIQAYNKAKIELCKTSITIPVKVTDKPTLKTYPVLTEVTTTAITGNNQITVNDDIFNIIIQYNEFTSTFTKLSRIYLLGGYFKITGIDKSNIGFLNGGNKGTIKFILESDSITDDDNNDLGVADYYKVFAKGTTPTPTPTPSSTPISFTFNKSALTIFDTGILTVTSTNPNSQACNFEIVGDALGCYFTNIQDTECTFQTSNLTGILNIKISLKSDSSIYTNAKIIIS